MYFFLFIFEILVFVIMFCLSVLFVLGCFSFPNSYHSMLLSPMCLNLIFFIWFICFLLWLIFFSFKFFKHLFILERQNMSGGEAERDRGRHRIGSRLQALSCQHRPHRGLQPTNHEIMT